MRSIYTALIFSLVYTLTWGQNIKITPATYQVHAADFNSVLSDFGPAYTEKGLIFTSDRDTGSVMKRRYRDRKEGVKRPYLELFERTEDGQVVKMNNNINKKYHESSVAITSDGNTLYITRSLSDEKGKLRRDKNGETMLGIFKSTMTENGWGEANPISLNSTEYSIAQPSLSSDNKWLYFVSNAPETFGQTDIYKVSLDEKGNFGTPENLGPKINSESNDLFPFISKSGDLYFTSNREGGKGGLDLYVARDINGIITILNLGDPINTKDDDLSLIFNDGSKTGYLASNREGGQGSDDIYNITEVSPLIVTCKQMISGIVTDKVSGEVLPNSLLVFKNAKDELIEIKSDEEGHYEFTFDCENNSYNVNVSEENHESVTDEINVPNDVTELEKDYQLPVNPLLADLNGLESVNFDYNKWRIKSGETEKLDKVVAFMNKYPEAKMTIKSHTDIRGRTEYNLSLSEKRAQTTLAYIVSKGVDASRVSAEGYGETQPVIACGTKCTEEEHLQNRRSEFFVKMSE